jgi:hypothetical protein
MTGKVLIPLPPAGYGYLFFAILSTSINQRRQKACGGIPELGDFALSAKI